MESRFPGSVHSDQSAVILLAISGRLPADDHVSVELTDPETGEAISIDARAAHGEHRTPEP